MDRYDFDSWREESHPAWSAFWQWTEAESKMRSRTLWLGFKVGWSFGKRNERNERVAERESE